VRHVAVGYDWESAAAMACQNGRADWAQWLRSGRSSLLAEGSGMEE